MEYSLKKISLKFAVSVLLVLIPACGYQFSGGGTLPGEIETVSIGIFENRTGETGVEAVLANYIVNQFTRFKSVRIVEKKEAEAVLKGTIKSSRIRTVGHSTPSEPTERRITLYLDVELTDPDGRTIWRARDISASDSYEMAPGNRRTEQNKKTALEELSERLAERIYYRLTDSF